MLIGAGVLAALAVLVPATLMAALLLPVLDRWLAESAEREELQLRLGLRVEVERVPKGSLPRWEGKSRRFRDRR